MTPTDQPFTVAVIGGGFSGTVLALKALAGLPSARIVIVDDAARAGRGMAYGACAPFHLLNVPVNRIEVGLEPRFETWLRASGADLSAALGESGGDLGAAFVARHLFGDYLQERLQDALRNSARLSVLHARAVALEGTPPRTIVLDNGRRIAADAVVLATGNLPPHPLAAIEGGSVRVSDPWARDARAQLSPQSPVLLVGTGLTMVDVALDLARAGHNGPMLAVSRHGILPAAHASGGQWAPFIDTSHDTPLRAFMAVRRALAQAVADGIPWQRVIDAVRPAVARLWHGWSIAHRRQFLRHLRARWTAIRHRMAPRIARELQGLRDSGQLRTVAGRIRGAARDPDGIAVEIARRGGGREHVVAAHVVNCTGPRSDYGTIEHPLLADLRRRGLIVPDPLGLGIETDDCAAIDSSGIVSTWLFAIGAPTTPAWWEITAVPEITLQIGRLVPDLLAAREGRSQKRVLLAEAFNDLGAGI